MPKYFEETPEEIKKPKRACAGLRDDLKTCLLESDCVRKVCHSLTALLIS